MQKQIELTKAIFEYIDKDQFDEINFIKDKEELLNDINIIFGSMDDFLDQYKIKRKKLSKEEKIIVRKNELANLMKKYTKNDCFDISAFRQQHNKEYMLIPHYFGSVNKAMEELNMVKLTNGIIKEGKPLTLRDSLAYDRILELRNQGYTYEDISKQYGVSKVLVSKLHKVLDEKQMEGM